MNNVGGIGFSEQGFSPVNKLDNVLNTLPSVKDEVKGLTPSKVMDKKLKPIKECETCKNRRYQDVSADPGVSFKTPTKLSPSQAAGSVMSHEREHLYRETSKASSEGKKVVYSNIKIFTSVCPECGKTYVSGGETQTKVASNSKDENNNSNNKEGNKGQNYPSVDITV